MNNKPEKSKLISFKRTNNWVFSTYSEKISTLRYKYNEGGKFYDVVMTIDGRNSKYEFDAETESFEKFLKLLELDEQ